ncbi:hypothetical protein KAT45_02655 [Candidatus Aerophobetes bacterium]|nr:hypothetical protein [Candidatus Aerophobetes bacterium]
MYSSVLKILGYFFGTVAGISLQDFIDQHEEEIATELPQIIIRQSLASFALQGV